MPLERILTFFIKIHSTSCRSNSNIVIYIYIYITYISSFRTFIDQVDEHSESVRTILPQRSPSSTHPFHKLTNILEISSFDSLNTLEPPHILTHESRQYRRHNHIFETAFPLTRKVLTPIARSRAIVTTSKLVPILHSLPHITISHSQQRRQYFTILERMIRPTPSFV